MALLTAAGEGVDAPASPTSSGQQVILDRFGEELLFSVPAGHAGCKLPPGERGVQAFASLDPACRIRLHLGGSHTPACTPGADFKPAVREVLVAPLVLDDYGLPQQDAEGRWVRGPPVALNGAQLAALMGLSEDGRRVIGYVGV
jgi:hypothetical protein